MPREKEGYRDMLAFLNTEKKAPMMLSRSEAANVLNISRTSVCALIADKRLEVDKITNKIPIGSIARYLCG